MRKFLFSFMLCAGLLAATAAAQQPTQPPTAPTQTSGNGISPNRVAGEVTALDATAHTITIKADGSNALVVVQLDDKTTKFYRAKPEALAHADKLTPADLLAITFGDISVGDRLVALGKVADDQKSVPARTVIMMTKADHTAKQEHDREEWRRRGIFGVVSAVNPTTKEITINTRSREGTKPVVVAASDTTRFRRYAPDSVKFSDARPSSLAELKVGDQLRALGERNEDGTRFTPEEIVTGSFRTVIGTVTAVDAAHNQLTIKNEQTKQPLTIIISQDSLLHRMPEQMAQMMAMRAQGGGGPGMFGGRPGGAQPGSQPPAGGPPAGGQPAGGEQGGMGQRRMGGGGGFDLQALLERLPPTTFAELKAGDVIIVSSTAGADPTRLTAINVIAGADALLAMMQPRPNQTGPAAPNLGSTGMPAGLDFGIGLP
jgi:hypothetical protein